MPERSVLLIGGYGLFGWRLASRLSMQCGLVVERMGPIRMHSRLPCEGRALHRALTQVRVLGLAWPKPLAPPIHAHERATPARFHVDIAAHMSGAGRAVAYADYPELSTAGRLA